MLCGLLLTTILAPPHARMVHDLIQDTQDAAGCRRRGQRSELSSLIRGSGTHAVRSMPRTWTGGGEAGLVGDEVGDGVGGLHSLEPAAGVVIDAQDFQRR